MSVISVSFLNLSLVSISCHVNLSLVFLFLNLYTFLTLRLAGKKKIIRDTN